MGNLPPEDLSREIERLWARVGSSSTEPMITPPTSPLSGGSELAWETVGLLKSQQRRREGVIGAALEAKEQSLRHWRERAQALEAEVSQLRAQAEGSDERVFGELLDAQRRLEEAVRAMEHERHQHEEERRRMAAALEEAREQFTSEAARARDAESMWSKREVQSLLDLRNLQETAERRQNEAKSADEAVRALKGGLAEAKNAIEKTLAELLLERQERGRVEHERERALKKADEIQAHFDELQKLWDEERAQWRELWDRERSTWEAQRQELAQWEETLRREREAWHVELQEKERTHLTFTDSLSTKIRETTVAADQVAERMKSLETREESDRARREMEAQTRALSSVHSNRRARWAAGVAAVLALALLARPAWRWGDEWRYVPEMSAPVAAPNPTALAYDGSLLWVSDWSGRMSGLDPAEPRRAARE
ncbi:MAG: hypothetical protein HYZ74_07960, partial [Elusimicrobia bacterium]|nr:hypothetical protein [Elusimicrobiota bacterium]